MRSTNDLCIAARGVAKRFSRSLKRSLIYGAADIVREVVGRSPDPDVLRPSEFWALRDISFDLRRGTSLGIVGPNGSGKTTLLRIISGILKPTAGEILIWGKIAPLLALGAGFKPVLSGRENVFINMALLGVPPEVIARRFDEVVEFAELWDAIEAPVGTYSSGMLARLGFSCAIHIDPEILIIDEILAVGDARFRAKCRNRINALRRSGTTFLIVSHSPINVLTLSDECLLMQSGQLMARGKPEDILRQYDTENARRDATATVKVMQTRKPARLASLSVQEITLGPTETPGAGFLVAGRPGEIRVSFTTQTPVEDISVNVIVASLDSGGAENILFVQSCRDVGWFSADTGKGRVVMVLPAVNLGPGSYSMKLSVSTGTMFDVLDVVEHLRFTVTDPGFMFQNKLYQPREWNWEGLELTKPAAAQRYDPAEIDES